MAATPQQQVQQILAGQYAPLDLAFQQANAQAARQQASLVQARRQLVAQLQRGVGPAGAYYNQGVVQQQALANAAGAALAHANPDATVQANLAAVGAPQAQRQMVANQAAHDYAGQAAVLGTLQGAIPGAALVAGRSAARQFAAGLPTVAALSGEQSLRALANHEAQTRDKYLADRLQIAGQAPQLLMDLQAAQAKAAADAQAFNAEQAYRADQLAIDRYNAETSRRNQQSNPPNVQIFGSGSSGYYAIDPKTGQPVQIVKGTGGGKAPNGLTPAQVQAAAADLAPQVEDWYYGVQPKQKQVPIRDETGHIVSYKWVDVPNTGQRPVMYGVARRRLVARGLTRRQAEQILNQFYQPGEGGRPALPYRPVKPPKGAGATGAYGKNNPRSKRPG